MLLKATLKDEILQSEIYIWSLMIEVDYQFSRIDNIVKPDKTN
ncbi:hypothetical protein CFB3_12780 [Clostridium folliculivorans]|uniref:Uncharacterized protein n=1 Tax=Clostridium folliculivorans TaxID=2886038 RepID=A0A9W6DCG7_9CLOT|nr:hypothetical protein CFOLD11_38130 [Clostridium folliculivorans]GKU29172.1 hypothetical protein CFB3_12780 [Clostridium folliculivorans]